MTRPVVSSTVEDVYASMGAMQDGDEASGWGLLKLCRALCRNLEDFEADAADTDTQAGWGRVLDVSTAMPYALPYLAQYVGASLASNLTVEQRRNYIRSAPGQKRGCIESLKDSARVWLSGGKNVSITERPGGDAYAYTVTVYSSEVVDLAELTRAMMAAKPAGLMMTLVVVPGWSVDDFEGRYAGESVTFFEDEWSGSSVQVFEREVP